jgi:hypothetical protein
VYDTGPTEERYTFTFPNPEQSDLLELKTRYGLEARVAGSNSNLERVCRICAWVHGLCGRTMETMNPASRTH